MFESTTDQLRVALQDRVAVLTLNRPETRNALTDEMREALVSALEWARSSEEVGAVLLTGAGQGFCSGADVRAMGGDADASAEARFKTLVRRHTAMSATLRGMAKPSVAVLPGPAVGAGLALALACDLRVMSSDTFMMTGYVQRALSGDYGVAWLLSRVVGPGRARQLLLTGERVYADAALGMGLANEVTPAEDLQARGLALARQLAAGPQVAYGYIKQNLEEALHIDHVSAIEREADRLLKCSSTADAKEAALAFREKRPPNFRQGPQ